MKKISELSKNLKKNFSPKKRDFSKPVASWTEKDIIKGKVVDTLVIIFRTRGCTWAYKSGCSMCGYFNDSAWEKVTDKDFFSQYKIAMDKYKDQRFVKIFNSGSFLDETEISKNVRNKILKDLSKKVEKISFETRPEYVTEKNIFEIKDILKDTIIEIGIGLETFDDSIRKNIINKGYSFKDFKKAADILKKHDIRLKTYVLIKPPFLTEKESIDDAINTVKKIKDFSDVISFNPCNVQKNTVVEYFWKKNMYRPPYLFSVVEILKESKKIVDDNVRLKCDVAGGGSIRGAHNCRRCDRPFLKKISDFSINQNIKVFDGLDCECREEWLDQLDMEDFGFGSLVGMYR